MTLEPAHPDARGLLELAGKSALTLTFCRPLWRPGTSYLDPAMLRRDVEGLNPDLCAAYVAPCDTFFGDVLIEDQNAPFACLLVPAGADLRIDVHVPDRLVFRAEGAARVIAREHARLSATLRDLVTIFPDGRLFYSISILPQADGNASWDEFAMLALTKLVQPSEDTSSLRADVRFSEPGQSAKPLTDFITERLARLGAADEHPLSRVLSIVKRHTSSDCLAVTWADVDSGCLFIEDAHLFEQLQQFSANPDGTGAYARVTNFHALAGLAQNVLDYDRQDASEVRDSLDPVQADSHGLMFCHPRLTLKIVEKSRSFTQGRQTLGTCPYFFLLNLFAARERLQLIDLEGYVNRVKFGAPAPSKAVTHNFLRSLKDMLNAVSWPLFGGRRTMIRDLAEIRAGVFRDCVVHQQPVVFRYSTERVAFEGLLARRGVLARADAANRLLAQHESTVKDLHQHAERLTDQQIGRLLAVVAALGIVSALADLNALSQSNSELKWLAYFVAGLVAFALLVRLIGLLASAATGGKSP